MTVDNRSAIPDTHTACERRRTMLPHIVPPSGAALAGAYRRDFA